MPKEFTTYGHVDGEGKLSIYNKDIFTNTVKNHFKNTSVQLVFGERFYSFTDGQRSYYFAVIVKQIQKAWLASGVVKSLKEVDYDLRGRFLYFEELNEETGEYEKQLHTLKKGDTSVSKKMMREFCEKCIIWAVQNLSWAIPFPNEEFTVDDMTEHQRTVKKISVSDKGTL